MKHTLRTLLVATLIFGTAAASHAAVLLRIDARNPSQVFFHATTNASSSDTSGTRSFYGFTLIDFLTGSDRRGITGGSGNLISTASRGGVGPMTLPYNGVWTANYESGQYGSGNDLNIMVDPWPSEFKQIFTANAQAFSGTMTINLSGIASRRWSRCNQCSSGSPLPLSAHVTHDVPRVTE